MLRHLQKHCPVACKARVKQVRPWTYPSMVYVPLCTKLVMSDINRGELRFPLGILHCHSLPPACWERGAKALIPIGSLYRECRKQVGDSTQCLHISLDVASWRSAYAPFPPRKHCWPLVQVLENLLSINHWHRPAKIGAICSMILKLREGRVVATANSVRKRSPKSQARLLGTDQQFAAVGSSHRRRSQSC